MNKSSRSLVLVAALCWLASAMGCDKLRARDQMNKRVQS